MQWPQSSEVQPSGNLLVNGEEEQRQCSVAQCCVTFSKLLNLSGPLFSHWQKEGSNHPSFKGLLWGVMDLVQREGSMNGGIAII